MAQRQAFAIAAPFMMKELQLNSATTGLLLSAFFWSYSCAQLPGGWLVDRYGSGRVYGIGFLMWMSAVVMTSLASGVTGLILVQLLMGLGQGVPFPASARAVTNWFPSKERGGATGTYLSGNRLGQAAIAAIGPMMIVNWGWRPFFVVVGLAGVPWLIAWMSWSKDSKAISLAAAQAATALSPVQYLRFLRDRKILGIVLGFFAYDYTFFLLLRWMPVYLSTERKFGPRELALANSIPFAIVVFLMIPAGMAGDVLVRFGWNEVTARKTLITVGLMIACLIVPAAFVSDNVTSAWLLAGAVCGLGIAAPNAWLLTQAICARGVVATASGIQNFGGNLGGILSPALAGFVAYKTGSSAPAFGLGGVILLCGIVCYWLLIPNRPPERG